MNNRVTLTREELHNLVWSVPLRALSKKYQLSDDGFRKLCKRMMVPMPNGGHWARLPVNRKAPLKLSQRYSGDQTIVLLLRNPKAVNQQKAQSIALQAIAEELKSSHVVRVFDSLCDPDELIIASRDVLNGRDGKCWKYEGMLTSERTALDICVSEENVLRALCFMDALIKALMTRGYDVRIKNRETFAIVHDAEIKISFREKLHREVVERGTISNWTTLRPTGEVCFKAHIKMNDRAWQDSKETLEQQLPMILARLELEGQRLSEERAYFERQRKKQEQKDKRERTKKEKKQRELDHFKNMLDQSIRWRKAKDLREYIDAREQHAIATNTITVEFKRWLIWARQKADWYDPFIESKDKLLVEIEKDHPEIEKIQPAFENEPFLPAKSWFRKSFYHCK